MSKNPQDSFILKVVFPEKCNGCEMCVLEAQRQLGHVGLEGAFVRVFRKKGSFSIDVDPQINNLDITKIKDICPKSVFIIEEEPYELLS